MSIWLNGWIFVYKLSGCEFESRFCHLNVRYRACFEEGVPWHLGNCECRLTLKWVRDIIITYSQIKEWLNKNNSISLLSFKKKTDKSLCNLERNIYFVKNRLLHINANISAIKLIKKSWEQLVGNMRRDCYH